MDMHREDLDGTQLKVWEIGGTQDILRGKLTGCRRLIREDKGCRRLIREDEEGWKGRITKKDEEDGTGIHDGGGGGEKVGASATAEYGFYAAAERSRGLSGRAAPIRFQGKP